MSGPDSPAARPVIDVGPLTGPAPAAARARVTRQIQAACRERGFFYVTGHRVPAGLVGQLAETSAEFFALPLADKLEIPVEHGGRAWRGYFPVGAEPAAGTGPRRTGSATSAATARSPSRSSWDRDRLRTLAAGTGSRPGERYLLVRRLAGHRHAFRARRHALDPTGRWPRRRGMT